MLSMHHRYIREKLWLNFYKYMSWLYRSNAFMAILQQVYDKALKQPISFNVSSNTTCMQSKLRVAINLCKDALPPLLKIDEYFGMTATQIQLNPQLRSLTPLSMKTTTTINEDELPSSVSFCLLKVQFHSDRIYIFVFAISKNFLA